MLVRRRYVSGYDGGGLGGKSRFDRALEYEAAGRIATACAEYKAYAEECAAVGRYEEAITCLLKVQSYGYLSIDGRVDLAELYRLNGKRDKSAKVYKSAADDLTAQGKPDDAVGILRDAVSQLPDQISLIYGLARLYEDLGISSHAVSLLMESIYEHPDDTEAMIELAKIYRNRNSISEAVDTLMRAAEVYESRGDNAGVAKAYELILEVAPGSLGALKKLVDIYRKLGDDRKTIEYMHAMAGACVEQNNKERALNIYGAILELNPNDELAREYVGKSIQFISVLPGNETASKRTGDREPRTVEKAPVTESETSSEISPKADVADIKADFPPEKQVRTDRGLLGLSPEKGFGNDRVGPQVNYDLGLIYLEMGLNEKGIEHLQRASRDPTFRVRACNLLGLSFLDIDMPDIAIKEFERGLETPGLKEDEEISLAYNLASAYEAAGDIKAALEELRRVYSMNINYMDVKDKLVTLAQKKRENGD
jgi:tetratricopeptide (TPR) repeat protein